MNHYYLAAQPWVLALGGTQDDLELQLILHRSPKGVHLSEAQVLAELSRRRKKYGEPRKRSDVLTTGGGGPADPAWAWLSPLELQRYRALTTGPPVATLYLDEQQQPRRVVMDRQDGLGDADAADHYLRHLTLAELDQYGQLLPK